MGSSTGLTKPGSEQAYLDEIATYAKIAAAFGGAQPIIFVGQTQPDVPWETQRSQIVGGLKKAGDIAKEEGVVLVMEPLSSQPGVRVWRWTLRRWRSPQSTKWRIRM